MRSLAVSFQKPKAGMFNLRPDTYTILNHLKIVTYSHLLVILFDQLLDRVYY